MWLPCLFYFYVCVFEFDLHYIIFFIVSNESNLESTLPDLGILTLAAHRCQIKT